MLNLFLAENQKIVSNSTAHTFRRSTSLLTKQVHLVFIYSSSFFNSHCYTPKLYFYTNLREYFLQFYTKFFICNIYTI